jgi:pseudouridine-5'-phosphate glycosidase
MNLRHSAEVAAARAAGRPVVALESTITSNMGLPAPYNRECFDRVNEAIRSTGAVPAVTAVIDGELWAGIERNDEARILEANVKLAERDLPVAMASKATGVTTVSATVTIAGLSGIRVFATGGIGGVHRGAEQTYDISSDLGAMSRHPVIVVSAGAKAFLDLPKTLEVLESLSVPVLGFQTNDFPAFWSRSSGLSLTHRVERASEIAAIFHANIELGWRGGMLVANPIPAAAEIPGSEISDAIAAGLEEAERAGATGPKATPKILAAIAAATNSRSIPANLALAESNARLAGEIALALAIK